MVGRESESPFIVVMAGGRRFIQPAYRIRCCGECGLYYKTETLSVSELSQYYSIVDFTKWEIPDYFPTERAVLKHLRSLPLGSRVLDIGCSTGRLLAGLVSDYDCHGFEINTDAANQAARKGLRMLTAKELATQPDDRFDAVVLVDVFEHLDRPLAILIELCRILRPGGILVLATGNGDAPYCRRNPANFWYFQNLEHLCMLSSRHAAFLERKLNCRLMEWTELSHYDVGFVERAYAHVRDFAYWGLRPESPRLMKAFLRWVPVFRRAEHWSGPPLLSCTRDHVVSVFKKQ